MKKPLLCMVLDSFEHLGKEDKLLFVPIINKLREALQKQALNLYVGCGGQTPKLDINTILHPKPMEQDLYMAMQQMFILLQEKYQQ
ncbi:MAG: hypothetical protein QFX12_03185 [Rickettsia africae]|uniref:hypothetical protein n=2 Tax=Rickettsia TaxID=780 RepID=UPI0002F1AA77|nr:hypothetical protein [Rickettsia africae]